MKSWWPSLLVAAALSVLLHASSWLAWVQAFEFKFPMQPSDQTMNTRMIAAPPASATPATPAATAPVIKPSQPERSANALAPAKAPSNAPARSDAKPADNTPAIKPPDLKDSDQNQPLPGINTAQAAIEKEASSDPQNPSSPNTTLTAATTEAAAAGAAPNLQGAAPTPVLRWNIPPSMQLSYEVVQVKDNNRRQLSGQLDWKSNGSEYALGIDASLLVLTALSQTSVGEIGAFGLMPIRFSDKRLGRSEQAAHFDRKTNSIKFSNNKPDAPLIPGVQDRLSVLVQLAGILRGDPERYKIVNRIVVPVAGVDGLETWEFRLEGESDINLPAANMRALKLVREPRHEFDQRLELWLATELGHLPVRMRYSALQNPEADYLQMSLMRLPR